MTETPLVSALITTHNRKELLEKAINSVLKQTYSNIECIVVDDASSDGTQNYIKKYIDEGKICYIRIEENETKGGNYARNRGIFASKGEYIAFLDDDDEWFPTKIEKQVNLAMTIGVGFIYCGRTIERNFDVTNRIEEDINNGKKFLSGDILSEATVHSTVILTSTMLIKKKLLKDVGMFDEDIRAWQEYEMEIRILQKTRAAVVRENLVLYRVIDNDKNRISNNINEWERSIKLINEKHKELIKGLSFLDETRRKLYIYIDGIQRSRKARAKSKQLKYSLKIILNPAIAIVAFLKKTIMKNGVL